MNNFETLLVVLALLIYGVAQEMYSYEPILPIIIKKVRTLYLFLYNAHIINYNFMSFTKCDIFYVSLSFS